MKESKRRSKEGRGVGKGVIGWYKMERRTRKPMESVLPQAFGFCDGLVDRVFGDVVG